MQKKWKQKKWRQIWKGVLQINAVCDKKLENLRNRAAVRLVNNIKGSL